MTLQDHLRRQTQESRDLLKQAEAKCDCLRTERSAADERRKRASTEITTQRALEIERKRLVAEADSKVAEMQVKLDEIQRQREEIERQCSELIDRWQERKNEKDTANKHLKLAIDSIEKAQAEVKKLRDSTAKANYALTDAEKEQNKRQEQLRLDVVEAMDVHLKELAKRIEQAFANEEERQQHLAKVEAFKRARHEDGRIGDLCDQREQFRKLVKLATVPGVKETIQAALGKIEDELNKLYPGALAADESVSEIGFIEELHYFTDREGKAGILLPIDQAGYEQIGNGQVQPSSVWMVHLVWNMVKHLVKDGDLKHDNARFRLRNGRCLLLTSFSEEDMSIIDSFKVSMPSAKSLQFKFALVPNELQEALVHET